MNLEASAHYRVITFEHANLKRPLKLVAGTIVGFHWSEPSKANVIYTAGGLTYPVTETLEQIEEKIKGEK